MSDLPATRAFDSDALRERYRLEREKRLRPDGNEQYIEMTGEFARYLDDPYIDETIEREPKTDRVDVVIVGGGFGGQQAAARLIQAGVHDLCLVEKAGDFGGTWYWNRYPGAQCDIESYCYLPLLEELGYVPKEKYAYAREILDHSEAIGRHFGLYDKTLFQTEVTALEWNENARRWIVRTNHDDAIQARFVCMANGPLHRPKLPGIPGIRDYRGHTFHTSRWDYRYTGGGPDGGLDRLADKRVAIIGTGATAIQCVPFLGEAAKHLYVVQRTPSSVDVRGNMPTDPAWAAGLDAGWQKRRMENFNALVSGVPQEEDLVDDGWTDLIGKTIEKFRKARADDGVNVAEVMESANFEKMEEIRARVDDLVDDDAVAEKLKPYYQMFCKRPTFNDDYLPTFNRPNVTLLDTDGQGAERITAKGVVVRREVDDGYGRYIDVRHANGYMTRYAHLRGWASGTAVGASVAQGQVIGYVGMTGLATGPHLHYEMHRDGRPVDPLAVDLPAGEPVPAAELARWEAERDGRLNLLLGLVGPETLRTRRAAASRTAGGG